jgi:starch-binding outer membrane protein, SusD/RagB family
MRKTISTRVVLASTAIVLAGCGLLDTQQPNLIDPGALDSPEGAASARLGALADFAFANDGDGTQSQDGLILTAGLLSDEFIHSTTPPSEQEIDQRTTAPINPSLFSIFFNLHRARRGAEVAAEKLRQFSPEPDSTTDIAEMLAVAGFTYVYFGEDFCSGVPFSRQAGDTSVFGAPQTTTQTFQLAVAKFDSALAEPGLSADDGTITGLAAVGRARALLDLGLFDDAAAAVADVPTDFAYVTEHADAPLRIQNAIFVYTNQGLWSLSDFEGGNGLGYVTAEDPRVPFTDTEDTGLDLITPQINLDKYPAATSDVVVADGIEARLIEAEALLQSNDFSGMRTILNDLRDTQGLDPLPTAGSRDAAIDQLFSERAFWMFATGHRLGDMRRLIRQYGRDPDTVFPTGDYHKGGSYGSDVNFPLPLEEQNNPNSAACLDRNA